MFILDDLNITLSRGDTATLDLTFSGNVPQAGDTVVMSLKTSPNDKRPKWEKSKPGAATVSFAIDPQDTADLPFGTYYWDARIFYQNGNVTTPFPPKKFVVAEVITNARQS